GDNRLKRNAANRYLQDRESMRSRTFSGMGFHFHAQDAFATESQGPVQDRTQEHLVTSDKPLAAARKLLLKAINDLREGREPLHILREPSAAHTPKIVVLSEVIPADVNPHEYVKTLAARHS
ncbi:MAG TPA: hypothetical protein VEI95_01930, partial [Acidobacteriota bacterium]|nr:hypothetical protein [Acidobacteriota bacterium]